MREHNITITELRLKILETLANSKQPLSYEQFCLKANKTTFYRNIELFTQKGLVVKSQIDRKYFYELGSRAKAHFVCDVCHEITDIAMPKIKKKSIKGVVKSILISGICQKCE